MNPRRITSWLCVIAFWSQVQTATAQTTHPVKANKTPAKTSVQPVEQPAEGETDGANGKYQPDEALVKALRDAKVINPEYPLRVLKRPGEVAVTTLINPKATEKNIKIEAVLAAKALMEADKSLLTVHYRLKVHMPDPDYQLVIVRKSDVKAYGASAIDVDSLLAGLHLRHARRGHME